MLRSALKGLAMVVVFNSLALAQSVAAPYDSNRHHMGPTGKPCLTLDGSTKAQTINKDIYEHWVSAANSCGQHIKVRVCYYKTSDCITMDVPPWGRTASVLGIYPALKDFRYEAKEQFLQF
jgi:hypothetical protein